MDCEFLFWNMGFECTTYTMSNTTSNKTCATRAQARASGFAFHSIRDAFEPRGAAESWIGHINRAHNGFANAPGLVGDGDANVAAAGEKWDEFMSLGLGLFTPDLSAHLARWKSNGLGYLARSYVNSIDGATMYAIMTPNEHNGMLYEVHGLSVSDDYVGEFRGLEATACLEGFETGWESKVMHKWWQQYNQGAHHTEGAVGLPHTLVVKVSHPTNDADGARAFLGKYLGIEAETAVAGGGCKFATAGLKTYSGPGAVNLKFVKNPMATQVGSKSASEYVAYVEQVHKTHMGAQSGWDRFIDSHVGLVYRQTWLDDYAPAMADGGVGFHAYLDAWESDSICLSHSKMEESCGSIWTEGVSGFGMEMHAFFDYSWFKDDKDPELLYFWQTCTREEYELTETRSPSVIHG